MNYSKPESKDDLPSEINDHTVHKHPWIIHNMHWNFVNKEWYRLMTFKDVPLDFGTSAILLAASGFAFLVDLQTLICCFCGLQVELLETIERIDQVHKRKSRNCPMIKGNQCNNEPIKSLEMRERKVEVSRNSNVANSTVDMSSLSSQPIDDGASSVIITNITDLQESDEQEPGYSTDRHEKESTSASSRQSTTPKPNDNRNESENFAIEQNSCDNNSTNASETSTVNCNTNQVQSSTVHAPDNSSQSSTVTPSENSCQSSTVPPPNNSEQTNNESSSNADDNSEPEPISYDKLGIITARPKRPEYAAYTARKDSYEIKKWRPDHHIKPEDLANAGFFFSGYGDCARCFYCGGGLRNWELNDNVWIEHARWFPKCAYLLYEVGREFIDAVQEIHKEGETAITFEKALKKANGDESNPLTFKHRELARDPAVRTVIDNGFDQKQILILANEIRKTGSYDLLTSENLYKAALEKNLTRSIVDNVNSDSISIRKRENTERDDEAIQAFRNENSELRIQARCKICETNEAAVVFLPCGHLTSCTECSCSLSSCPLCRLGIKGVVRAFLS